MKALRVVFRLGLLIGLGPEIAGLPAIAQTTVPKEAQPPADESRKLTRMFVRRGLLARHRCSMQRLPLGPF